MNPGLKDIWEHMRHLGLGALAHANRHAAYAAMENIKWPELSVLQAAHAAELLIKARIAQEHPLLIFEQLPKPAETLSTPLELEDLFMRGKTVQWPDLLTRLWATTGLTIRGKEKFDYFGKLRNGLQHFGARPDKDYGGETLKFVFEVIDPFINQCWGLYAVDYDEDYEAYLYFVSALVSREIYFLVSPECAECFKDWNVNWAEAKPKYRREMHARVQKAASQKRKL